MKYYLCFIIGGVITAYYLEALYEKNKTIY